MNRFPQARGARVGLLGAVAVIAVAASGCSSASAPSAANQTFKSKNGQLEVALVVTPDPPVPGLNTAQYALTDATSGDPVDGLTVSIVPWMPVMGHGTSITPTVTDMGGGLYQITDLSLFMAGEWQLRTQFTGQIASGQVTDSAEPTFQVP